MRRPRPVGAVRSGPGSGGAPFGALPLSASPVSRETPRRSGRLPSGFRKGRTGEAYPAARIAVRIAIAGRVPAEPRGGHPCSSAFCGGDINSPRRRPTEGDREPAAFAAGIRDRRRTGSTTSPARPRREIRRGLLRRRARRATGLPGATTTAGRTDSRSPRNRDPGEGVRRDPAAGRTDAGPSKRRLVPAEPRRERPEPPVRRRVVPGEAAQRATPPGVDRGDTSREDRAGGEGAIPATRGRAGGSGGFGGRRVGPAEPPRRPSGVPLRRRTGTLERASGATPARKAAPGGAPGRRLLQWRTTCC